MKTKQREWRIAPLTKISVRSAPSGVKTIEGHAAVFNIESENHWGFVEKVGTGCFTRAITEDDVRALFNHNPDYVLGRNVSKTLRMSEDVTGLAFEVDMPDTQCARDLQVSIDRGDITGCSFSFSTRKDEWVYDKDGVAHRTLLDVDLYDVGPVTFPAYPETDVALRSTMQKVAELGIAALGAASGAPVQIRSTVGLRRRLELNART